MRKIIIRIHLFGVRCVRCPEMPDIPHRDCVDIGTSVRHSMRLPNLRTNKRTNE